MEYDKLEELLEKEGYTIEKIVEDGNCLFRAAARQLLGDEEKHQQVRDKTVEYIIGNKSFFADFEFDIDKRLSEQPDEPVLGWEHGDSFNL